MLLTTNSSIYSFPSCFIKHVRFGFAQRHYTIDITNEKPNQSMSRTAASNINRQGHAYTVANFAPNMLNQGQNLAKLTKQNVSASNFASIRNLIFDSSMNYKRKGKLRTGNEYLSRPFLASKIAEYYPATYDRWPRAKGAAWQHVLHIKRLVYKRSQRAKGKISFPKRRMFAGKIRCVVISEK